MIAGIPIITFIGIVIIGIGTIMAYSGTRSALTLFIVDEHKTTRKKVIDTGLDVNSKIDSAIDETKVQGKSTRSHFENILESQNSNLNLLKDHILNSLRLSVNEVVDSWSEMIRIDQFLKTQREKMSTSYYNEMIREKIELSNRRNSAVRKMRKEIGVTTSFVNDIALSDPEIGVRLITYLIKLKQPYNNMAKEGIGKKTSTPKNNFEIEQKYYREMKLLADEYDSIYKDVLNLR